MGKIKNKVYDWKDRLRDRKMLTLVISMMIIIITLGIYAYKKERSYRQLAENGYNNAFYQLIEYVNNTEKLLAKATISYSPEHGAETLTSIWRESTLAQSYLARLPIKTEQLENTQKFLNQVGDYCYATSKKAIAGTKLTQEELDSITTLHKYSVDLENTLNQLETDLYSGNIKWGELEKKGSGAISQEGDNLSQSSFSNIEEDLHQYTGLIYDGAYSEHLTNSDRIGLTGDDKTEEECMEIAKKFIGEDKISEITSNGESDNANIKCYSFNAKIDENNKCWITVSKKGGHVVSMDCNREVTQENIKLEEAVQIGKEFLENREYKNMKETYYMNQNNVLTVNYAYMQEDVIMYPDLIKVKIALDNGEVLGIESTGYLNSHKDIRELKDKKISKEEAVKLINPKLEIKYTGLAIIPTQWKSEIECWEIKGRAEDNDFIVYINVETGKEEDILMIIDTPNGTLTT